MLIKSSKLKVIMNKNNSLNNTKPVLVGGDLGKSTLENNIVKEIEYMIPEK